MPRAHTAHSRISTADVNAAAISAEGVRLTGYNISNTNAAARYVKLYNKATAPSEADTPVLRITVPAGQTVAFASADGVQGFPTGLGMRITTGVLDNDTAAVGLGDCVVNLFYDTLR